MSFLLRRSIFFILPLVIAVSVFLTVCISAADTEISKRPDGTQVTFDRINGVKTLKAPNGQQEVIDLKGKTPYGAVISENERIVFSKEQVVVKIRFDALRSDDLLQDDILSFYESLYSGMRIALSEKEISVSSDIVVVYCRFCEYSYCYKNGAKVLIEFVRANQIKQIYSFSSLDLNDKIKREENIVNIIEKLSEVVSTH